MLIIPKNPNTYSLIAILCFISTVGSAEIVLDGTLSRSGDILLKGNVFEITPDLGRQEGSNLFHSFETFNLYPSETANFSGPSEINNIISRVTGGNTSYINGTLHSAIENADMYFINPAGIMFGENASLDVKGSFYASTADYLRLGEYGRFDATHPNKSLLMVASPSAFGFLNQKQATISKRHSLLEVPRGETLSLIGGDLIIEDSFLKLEPKKSKLKAPDGRINLVSVASGGEVPIHINPAKISELDDFEQFGSISLTDVIGRQTDNGTNNANVDASDGDGDGSIYIVGGDIFMKNAHVWADTHGDNNGQAITIKAANKFHAKTTKITSEVFGKGNGGDINITARNIILSDGARIVGNNSSSSLGNASEITLKAGETINFFGFRPNKSYPSSYPSGLMSNAEGDGDAGQISVTTSTLSLTDKSIIYAKTKSDGKAGNVSLTVDKLTLAGGAQILLNTKGKGDGGTLTIDANEFVSVIGESDEPDDKRRSSALLSNTFGAGKSGAIKVTTPLLEVQDKGKIEAGTGGDGQGGKIVINVDKLDIRRRGIITARSIGKGDAGSIEFDTQSVYLDAGVISTEANSIGGNISFKVTDRLYVLNGELTTKIVGKNSSDTAGNITINKPQFCIFNHSKLLATANKGDGGEISIMPDYFISSNDSEINVSSQFGSDGKLTIGSPDIDISSGLFVSSKPFLNATDLINSRCGFTSRQNVNKLIVIDRDVPPITPDNQKTHYIRRPNAPKPVKPLHSSVAPEQLF